MPGGRLPDETTILAGTTMLLVGRVPGIGIGASGGVMVPIGGVPSTGAVITGALGYAIMLELRLRNRPNSPRRATVGEPYCITGPVVTTGVLGTTGVTGVAGWSWASPAAAYRATTATANTNFFMMLPPETH